MTPKQLLNQKHHQSVVSGVSSDDGSIILVVVCEGPTIAYTNKNNKHVGFIEGDRIVLSEDKDAPTVSAGEEERIIKCANILREAMKELQLL